MSTSRTLAGYGATISPCGKYRYTLERSLPACQESLRQILWVMLNPSTADAAMNDNTIRRCIDYSTRWGFGAMVVVNLYAYRATDPAQLWEVDDPVGIDNDDHIRELVACSDLTICAWGQPGPDRNRARQVRGIIGNASGAPPSYLKLNKDGSPGHPLYLPKALDPKEWR